MIKHNQDGAVNGLAIGLIVCIVLLVATLGLAAWGVSGRSDYKNNVDQKIAAAVNVAKQKEAASKEKQFAEEAKNPLKNYLGPEASGSLNIAFPKTWSGYVVTTGGNSSPLDAYFAPGVVPSAADQNAVFALRVQIISSPYDETVKTLQGPQQAGKLTVSAYALPKLPKVVGVKAVGQIDDQTSVNMIILPLRSQTLKIWTEGSQYLDDFNKYIIPNFTFSP